MTSLPRLSGALARTSAASPVRRPSMELIVPAVEAAGGYPHGCFSRMSLSGDAGGTPPRGSLVDIVV